MSVLKKSQLTAIFIFLAYSALFLMLFHSSHSVMLKWWNREDYNYCYLIPLIVLYLLWEKRHRLRQTPSRPSWIGFIPFMVGLILFWLGELGGEYYTMYLSSWFLLLGLCWIHFGWFKLKTAIFPIALILAMFPPPNFIYYNLSLKLKLISSQLGVWALQTVGKTAYREGNIIDLGFTKLQVVDACNGLRYLFPLIILAILVSYFSKSALWKKVFITISAIPISIFINGIRIASVGLLYPIWGPKVAVGFFHDLSGWIIFMISLGILLLELWLLNVLFKEKGVQSQIAKESNRLLKHRADRFITVPGVPRGQLKNYLRPLVAMIFLVISAGTAHNVNFREAIPIARPFQEFPLKLGQWEGIPQSMEQMYLAGLKFSDYIMANYQDPSGHSVNFYTAYYESQRKGESIHSPSSCLPGGGWVFHESGVVAIPLDDHLKESIRINRAFIQKGDYKQLSYYWFPMRGRVLTNIWQMKFYNFWDALTMQRTDGALIRLITPIGRNEKVQDADERLQAFLREIVPVLEEFLPQ